MNKAESLSARVCGEVTARMGMFGGRSLTILLLVSGGLV